MLCVFLVTITRPPENTTVCEGSKVTISCGYWSVSVLPVTWIINETSFTQHKIVNNPLYRLNNPTSPMDVSLTVFSINATTTFQCIVQSTPNTTSTRGAVTVTNGTYASYKSLITFYICIYNLCELLSSGVFALLNTTLHQATTEAS